MPILRYLIDAFYKRIRAERVEVKFPCKYEIFHSKENKDSYTNLKEGIIINLSNHGFGLITAPPFDDEFKKRLRKKEYSIYIEAFSPENDTNLKILGEVRWARSVKDISKPYSEIGILLKSVKDDSKIEILDSLFDSSKNT